MSEVPKVKVGDIFYESWGYDQTNIDFVKVIGLTKSGKTAICRMMGEKIVSTEGLAPLAEYIVPDGEYGEPFRLRVKVSVHNNELYLVGTYPFCDISKRFGYFWRWEERPVYQSHYA